MAGSSDFIHFSLAKWLDYQTWLTLFCYSELHMFIPSLVVSAAQ